MPAATGPAPHTALSALPALALDLETTGLDVRRDRIVQIGAVAMLGANLLEAPRIDQRIAPGVPVPERASRIHGLTDADLAGAPRFADFAAQLQAAMTGRVIVGHNTAFDLAVLRHEAARWRIPWTEPAALDVAMLAGALEPTLPDLGLETVASMFEVRLEKRHDALGDSLTAALVFARILERLRKADIRTLGEAQAFAARRDDLLLRQAQAGWHGEPGGALEPGRTVRSPERIDSYIYERRIADVMSAPPVFVAPATTLREAAAEMASRRIGALLVGDPGVAPAGILTERDLLRVIAERGKLESEMVVTAMSSPVESLSGDEMLYRALGRMTRRAIRHLCVVDAGGKALGMISQRDLLRHRAGSADALGDALNEARDAPALAAAYGRMPEVAAALAAEGIGGVEVARVVSHEIRALAARAAELSRARLEAEGRPAPAPWCLVVLGSGGRGESLLAADQDHALIHAGGAGDDAWFADFGGRVANLLDEAGLPLCKGGVMASNAVWRGTTTDWRGRAEQWLHRARPGDLLNVDIFFDLVPVAGASALARDLHADAVHAASRAGPFISLLAESVASLPPVFGWFGRPVVIEGRIDLKRNALLPITGMARTLALRAGSAARSTPERLRAAAAAGRLSEADADTLAEVHADVLGWVLQQQLADLAQGLRPSGKVETKSLGRKDTARLRAHLHRVDEILGQLRAAVAG